MKGLLVTYEAASGQAINFDKSGIFHNSNVPVEMRTVLSDVLGIFQPFTSGKYLSFPSLVCRSKKK